ncbi:MAG: Cation-transporting P-type ATPase [candidate division WWE3 bacterium GW2011_GWE1_41_27]|uniref:Cation-transporting P-type ATPase n=1 Tax=candidate division WWE3 bacterium GW2011_GWE1_41_27 TaxID=1619131 RepID=A0A0G0W6U0_UNCKA|nr:MAG: Cation-transporting P-type ATPase [candidate division WWE3 bacterium GW2011_GWE1_41_27]
MRFSKFTALTPEKTVALLGSDIARGLTQKQIDFNLFKYGPNTLRDNTVSWVQILLKQVQSSFIYLLLFAALISLVLGEKTDAFFIVIFVLINCGLGFFHEYRSEKTIQLLRKFVAAEAHVIRGGVIKSLDTKELVVGDIVVLEAGDLVPADIRLILLTDFAVDESALSGESVTVRKRTAALKKNVAHIFLAENILFSGTHVVSGQARGVVIAVGKETQIGRISDLATSTVREGAFEKELRKLSGFILKLVFSTLLLVFILNIFVKPGGADLIKLSLFSIALAVSVIPEALPVVATFALSSGALNLAKKQVVVKRLASIEDLGSIEVLCSDKTGTLTENKLEVREVLSADMGKTLFYGGICSSDIVDKKNANNSFDLAIHLKLTDKARELMKKVPKILELPFDPDRRRNSVLVQLGGSYELIVRGAPDTLINYAPISNQDREKILNWVAARGRLGERVLAVASKKLKKPSDYKAKFEETGLEIIGLISFSDPLKKTTVAAVRKAQKLGVEIKILTGDSREIAGAVAFAAGLTRSPEDVITGMELEDLSANELADACLKYKVFARVSPEQKHKIILTLKNFYSVGYLGEGINDAPALKAANVGIVVKDSSDIARESADIILLNKGLEVLVDGVHEGRKVFANVSKYIRATLASNFGNFYAVAISTLFIDYLPMLPVQLLLLNLLSDFPMIAISGDTVDSNELTKPSKFNLKQFAVLASLLGLVSTVFDLTVFGIFFESGEGTLQTYWFIASVLTELAFIYSIRTKGWFFKAKAASAGLVLLSIAAVAVTIALPFSILGQVSFNFVAPTYYNLAIVGVLVVAYFGVSEIIKKMYFARAES